MLHEYTTTSLIHVHTPGPQPQSRLSFGDTQRDVTVVSPSYHTMQSLCSEFCSFTTSTTPTPSQSRSRSSGRHTHDRGRSGRSPRHRGEARQSHDMRYSRSSGSRRRSGHRDGHHSPSLNNYDKLSRRVQTAPVDRSRHTQYEQPQYAPTRRSTLPSYPEKAKLRPSRHPETPRLGFDPLANRHAYQGVDSMDKTRSPRAEDKGRSSRRRGTNAVQTSTRSVATAPDRDYWVKVREDARNKPFKKLDDEFWHTQLTKKEQSAAIETFEDDFKSGYAVNLHPYLKGEPVVKILCGFDQSSVRSIIMLTYV
jgi:hypothetical protein